MYVRVCACACACVRLCVFVVWCGVVWCVSVKSQENNGTEEIGLVTPTPGLCYLGKLFNSPN